MEQAVFDTKQKLAEKQMHHDEAVQKLKALRKEKAQGDAELAEINAELKRLSELV